MPHGWGTRKDPTGKTYTGDFINGERTGYGTMVFPSGIKYVGDFLTVRACTVYNDSSNGRSVSGTWVNGNYLDNQLKKLVVISCDH